MSNAVKTQVLPGDTVMVHSAPWGEDEKRDMSITVDMVDTRKDGVWVFTADSDGVDFGVARFPAGTVVTVAALMAQIEGWV